MKTIGKTLVVILIQLKKVSDAFSQAETDIYDSYGQNNIITYARDIVYKEILQNLKPKSHILDLGCGTGSDAMFLAKMGHKISAVDISSGMIDKFLKKIQSTGFEDRITVYQGSYTNLLELGIKNVDYVLSNFGALNCVSNFRSVVRDLKVLLKPGGYLTWVIMPTICPWELFYLPKGANVATRRLRGIGGRPVDSQIEGQHFDSYYFSPRHILNALGKEFRKIKLRSICLAVPPLYMDHVQFTKRRPRFFSWLRRVEHYLAAIPLLNSIGDFFLLTVKYEPKK